MAVDSVRRLADSGDPQRLPFERITQFDWGEEEVVDAVDLLEESGWDDGYPFAGQTRTYRSFEFTTEPMFGSPKSASGVLEVREESGFVFLILDQDTPKPDTIFSELRDGRDNGFPLETDFSPTYEAICNFIRKANEVIKLETPRKSGNPVEDVLEGENLPVEVVRLRFQYGDQSGSVTYADGQLNIPILSENLAFQERVMNPRSFREYVIQLFETAFYQD